MEYKKTIIITKEEIDSNNGDSLFILDREILEFNNSFPSCERIQTNMTQLSNDDSTYTFEVATIFNIVGELTVLEKAILGVNDYSNN